MGEMAMALKKSDAPWTYEDLRALPDDGKRYEIIEGDLFELPTPTLPHASAIMNLIMLAAPLIEALGGRIFTGPLDVFLRDADVVEPDIVAVLPGSRAALAQRGIEGAPDFIVEVISPECRGHDELTKRTLYALAGVQEYWLVDPHARSLNILTLDQDALHTYGTFAAEAMVRSPLLEATFPVASVFAGIEVA
ncbi:MAG TPA: Uma2 family endonuclease, partial [Thermomicrobiales bacterium]|nr:Uma2 family endonuclease [Thermomicrobiales bacterium]